MRYDTPLLPGVLLRRYKRFLADVRLADGRELTVHCPDPGALLGCSESGSPVLVSDSGKPGRKLRYTWEQVEVGGSWVSVHPGRSNAVVREAIEAGRIPELAGFAEIRREVGLGGSRIDFLLVAGSRRCFLEVKTTTHERGGVAMFPDAPTARGRKHLRELAAAVGASSRAVVLFLVSRDDCHRFGPAGDVDAAYADELRRASGAGVEILAWSCRVAPSGIDLLARLPVGLWV